MPKQPESRFVLTDVKDMFQRFDENGNGLISKEEIMAALKRLNLPVSEDEIGYLITQHDKDGDNNLGYDEFLLMVKEYMGTMDYPVDGMFKYFDEDGDGYISVKEFVKSMRCLGVDMTEEKAFEIIPQYCGPDNLNIGMDHFKKIMMNYV